MQYSKTVLIEKIDRTAMILAGDVGGSMPQPEPDAPVDAHGSQVELLKKSRCFQSLTNEVFDLQI
jgi:hypothetical protein